MFRNGLVAADSFMASEDPASNGYEFIRRSVAASDHKISIRQGPVSVSIKVHESDGRIRSHMGD